MTVVPAARLFELYGELPRGQCRRGIVAVSSSSFRVAGPTPLAVRRIGCFAGFSPSVEGGEDVVEVQFEAGEERRA